MIPTTEKLARALVERRNRRLDGMIRKAREGYYDDYQSQLAMPIAQLISDLLDAGEWELAQRAQLGEFDGTPEEANDWANSPEGQEARKKFSPL